MVQHFSKTQIYIQYVYNILFNKLEIDNFIALQNREQP